MINTRTTVLIAVFAVLAASVYSQTDSESVILYNNQPVKVELSEKGQIQSFIGLVPGYMQDYNLANSPIDFTPVKEEEIASKSAALTKNAGYSILSLERVELNYKPNFATLDKTIINKLDKVVAKLKADPTTRILLTVHTLNQEKNKLSTNRLNSAIAYLGIKGIPSDRIETDIQKSKNMIDVIAVDYLN